MIGPELGLSALAMRGSCPPLLIDFVEGRYQRDGAVAASFATLGGVTFSRTGAGTAVTQAGGVAGFATGAARITDKGLLLEAARTNILPYSTDFASGYAGSVVVTAGPTSPMGVAARTLTVAGGAGYLRRSGTVGAAVSTAYVLSALMKRGTARWGFMRSIIVNGGGPSDDGAWFDLQNGVVGFKGAKVGATGMIPLGDGWWLCWQTATTLSTITNQIIDFGFCNADATIAATNGETGYLTQVDLQAGAALGSPIVTTTASATRGADAAGVTVPAGATTYTATYGPSGTVVSGSATPGATFDLTSGRPWVGLGNELKRLVMQ